MVDMVSEASKLSISADSITIEVRNVSGRLLWTGAVHRKSLVAEVQRCVADVWGPPATLVGLLYGVQQLDPQASLEVARLQDGAVLSAVLARRELTWVPSADCSLDIRGGFLRVAPHDPPALVRGAFVIRPMSGIHMFTIKIACHRLLGGIGFESVRPDASCWMWHGETCSELETFHKLRFNSRSIRCMQNEDIITMTCDSVMGCVTFEQGTNQEIEQTPDNWRLQNDRDSVVLVALLAPGDAICICDYEQSQSWISDVYGSDSDGA